MLLKYFLTSLIVSKTNAFSIAVTGDVNFHPNLTNYPPEYAWGNVQEILQNFDLLFINHESTSSNLDDPDPNNYKYEDPMNYTSELLSAGSVSFTGQSNNHQFDFWDIGVNRTMTLLASLAPDQIQGGLYNKGTQNDQHSPEIFSFVNESTNEISKIAIFSIVAQLCHKNSTTGEDIMDSCTCGIPSNTSSGFSDMPPAQCYGANESQPGLWYLSYPLSEDDISNAEETISQYSVNYPSDIIFVNIHAGPNFEWEPASDRESLLRRLSDAGADVVWGTSSHHTQRMERRNNEEVSSSSSQYGRPIIYGLGDLLFRFIPGVDAPETCEAGMAPCERFRPAISVIYEFVFETETLMINSNLHRENKKSSSTVSNSVHPLLKGIRAHPTKHDSLQVNLAEGKDRKWFQRKFNELSLHHGFKMQEDGGTGDLWVVPS